MLGVALFATLAYVVARSMRSDTASALTKRQIELAATDIIDYAQRLEHGVARIRRKSISESDISFEYNADYINTACDTGADPEFPGCLIFDPVGGGLSYLSPSDDVTTAEWHFTGETCIIGIGTGVAGCDSDADISNEELLTVLPNIAQSVCEEINDRLGIGATPASVGGHAAGKFTGAFADGTVLDGLDGVNAACFSNGGNFHFYQVLIAR
ncbi:MAG: hypothetical protein DHS20C02_12140 [Micavibrio sp.]|nr:MAG: hypothetical protein DHS20C02_12140 [Micavibrio sp.]